MFISVSNLIIKPRKIKSPRSEANPTVCIRHLLSFSFFMKLFVFFFYVLTYYVRNCLALNQVQNAQALNCSVTEDDREKIPCWWKHDLFLKVVIKDANQLNTNFTYIAVFEKKEV